MPPYRIAILLLSVTTLLASKGLPQTGTQIRPSATGTVRLIVHDPSGRSIVDARAVLQGPVTRTAVTEQDGSLTVSNLPLGAYALSITKDGFATQRLQQQVVGEQPVNRAVTLSLDTANTSVDVVAAAPIGGLGVALNDIPLPVQSVTDRSLIDTNAIDMTETLKKRLNGVYVNENQNNPFQPDVNYRGFTASPLLGTPQGLSVYLDGVRQNQPFGDVVSWEFIPKIAIADMVLIPGSNPVYGLNTLGGAIAVHTKDGLSHPGLTISGYGGSFGRRALEGEWGGSTNNGFNWFASGTLFHEDGWRVLSPSSVRQSFAKLGWNRVETAISVSGAYSLSSLTGNGTQDFRTLARSSGVNSGYSSVYSIPDTIVEHSPSLTLNLTHTLSSALTVNANSYIRYIRGNSANGNINSNSFTESLYTLTSADRQALTAAGVPYPSYRLDASNTPYPYLRCIAQGLELSEPVEKCNGINNTTTSKQHAYGASAQLSWQTAHNQLAVGGAWDHGTLSFLQNAQFGYLNADRYSITLIPSFADGSTNANGTPVDSRVNLHGNTNTPGFYATDTLTAGRWVFTVAGRFNHITINNVDRLPATDYRGTLTAINTFERFNPSAGVVYRPNSLLNAYFDYSESSRAPTSNELGCADPNFPCNLPNAMVSDPPLKQVHTRTFEDGLRGNPGGRYRWQAGYFHTDNYDDLLFVSSDVTGNGYFLNFGKTRRQGVEAAVSTHLRGIDGGANYTFLNATYETAQTIGATGNSTNSNATSGLPGVPDGGTIDIKPGDHIPEVPQHMLKLYADARPTRKLSVNADLNLISSAYVRGNENNEHQPDGVYYLGKGTTPGYGVVNVGSRYTISSHFGLFAQVNNLLNRHYYTAGQLAATPYDGNGNFIGRPFGGVTDSSGNTSYAIRNSTYLSPGAPVTVFGGLRVTFSLH